MLKHLCAKALAALTVARNFVRLVIGKGSDGNSPLDPWIRHTELSTLAL